MLVLKFSWEPQTWKGYELKEMKGQREQIRSGRRGALLSRPALSFCLTFIASLKKSAGGERMTRIGAILAQSLSKTTSFFLLCQGFTGARRRRADSGRSGGS